MRRFRIISAFLAVVFVLGMTGCEALRKQPSDSDDYWFDFERNKNRWSSTVTICNIPFHADIESLNLYEENVSDKDMAEIERLKDLTHLSIRDCGVEDITPLKNLTGLTHLDLSNNQISDITPLENLTELTTLDLRNNQISDITLLKNLTELTSLDLCNNQISDITPLENLTYLEKLLIYGNKISDEDLVYLKSRLPRCEILCNLDFVTIAGGKIRISDTFNLFYYEDDRFSYEDIIEMGKLVNLVSLSLIDCGIKDITPFKNLTGLTFLNLSNNQISDITPLKNLTNLETLYLDDNQISDITPLENLTNLKTLYLFDNQISNEDLVYLKSRLSRCNILCDLDVATIAGEYFTVSGTTNLTLSNQPVSDEDMAEIAKLVNLTSLSISRCGLKDITQLKNLTKLTWLALDRNQISDITPLENLTNLKALYLFDNQISYEQLEWLRKALPDCEIYC